MPRIEPIPSRSVTVLIKLMVVASVVAYFVEVEIVGSPHSLTGPVFFLWFERFVATVLTAEYVLRIRFSANKAKYILSPLGIVDLLSILPFWLGFLLPDNVLGFVRTLRVLRLAKFYRYSEGLQNLFAGLKEDLQKIRAVGQVVLLTLAMSTAAIHVAEGAAQPDKFGKLSHCLWFSVVTMATVGYGDSYPITNMGRIVAMILIVVGVGILGAFIGIFGNAMFKTPSEVRSEGGAPTTQTKSVDT